MTAVQEDNLKAMAPEAVQVELETGVPAEFIAAQWATESGWGEHSPGNNCFGIKEYPGCSGRQLLSTSEYFTDEQAQHFSLLGDGREILHKFPKPGRDLYIVKDWFATFPTLADCFRKRVEIFSEPGYRQFLETYKEDGDLQAFIVQIAHLYATSPNYDTLILRIISMPEVTSAISQARNPDILPTS